MKARTRNILEIFPGALKAIMTLNASLEKGKVPPRTLLLVDLRASQVNGCSVCVALHARGLKDDGETDDRLFAVAAWRESPFFTDAERAALALTEAATRINDRSDPVSDEIWDEAAKYYNEEALEQLVVRIGIINLINRVNVATRQLSWAGARLPADLAKKLAAQS